jgi:hypothetical protein
MINLIYKGKRFMNCSPTGDQKSALANDQAFGAMLRSSYGTDFAEAQGLFNELHSNLASVIAAGASQEGMSPAEKAARNSQAINSAAASNKNIQAAIGEKASMNTGAPAGVESGIVQSERANAAASVENNLSNEEANITQENYKLGRENYDTALKADMELPAKTMDPVTSAGGQVNQADKVTNDQTNENAKASSSWMGLVGGLADAAVGGLTSGIGGKKGGSKATN